jgi:hypothetical protein
MGVCRSRRTQCRHPIPNHVLSNEARGLQPRCEWRRSRRRSHLRADRHLAPEVLVARYTRLSVRGTHQFTKRSSSPLNTVRAEGRTRQEAGVIERGIVPRGTYNRARIITALSAHRYRGPLHGCTQYLRTHSTEHSETIARHHGAGLIGS